MEHKDAGEGYSIDKTKLSDVKTAKEIKEFEEKKRKGELSGHDAVSHYETQIFKESGPIVSSDGKVTFTIKEKMINLQSMPLPENATKNISSANKEVDLMLNNIMQQPITNINPELTDEDQDKIQESVDTSILNSFDMISSQDNISKSVGDSFTDILVNDENQEMQRGESEINQILNKISENSIFMDSIEDPEMPGQSNDLLEELSEDDDSKESMDSMIEDMVSLGAPTNKSFEDDLESRLQEIFEKEGIPTITQTITVITETNPDDPTSPSLTEVTKSVTMPKPNTEYSEISNPSINVYTMADPIAMNREKAKYAPKNVSMSIDDFQKQIFGSSGGFGAPTRIDPISIAMQKMQREKAKTAPKAVSMTIDDFQKQVAMNGGGFGIPTRGFQSSSHQMQAFPTFANITQNSGHMSFGAPQRQMMSSVIKQKKFQDKTLFSNEFNSKGFNNVIGKVDQSVPSFMNTEMEVPSHIPGLHNMQKRSEVFKK